MSNASIVPLLIVLLVGSVPTLAGVALIVLGRRGRRVGDHPHCRRCGFDLVGAPATSDRCPECGADLRAPRATVIGTRVRRPAMIVAGVAVALLATLGTLFVGTRVARGIDWQAIKPVWWLLRESRSDVRATREAALDSLTQPERFDATLLDPQGLRLDADDERRLIARVLEVQADASIPWRREWGDVVARRIADGALPADQRDAFLRAALGSATLAARADVRAGDPLPTRLTLGSGRIPADAAGLTVGFADADERAFIDGQPSREPVYEGTGGGRTTLGTSAFQSGKTIDARWLAGLATGAHTVELRTVARVHNGFYGPHVRELAAFPVAASAPFTVHPADATLIEFVDDESMRPAIEAALSNVAIDLRQHTGSMNVQVGSAGFPMPVAFAITIRQGDRTWPASSLSTGARSGGSWGYGLNLKGLEPGVADVVFTSDPAAAARTVDVVRAWRGEVVVRDVKVSERRETRAP